MKFLQTLLVCSIFLIHSEVVLAFSVSGKRSDSRHRDPLNIFTQSPVDNPVTSVEKSTELKSRRDFMAAVVATTAAVAVVTPTSNPSVAKANEIELSSETLSEAAAAKVDWEGIFNKSKKRALGGGKAGASAAVVQVCSLMWLRTAMNYQYRYGGNLASSLETLWAEGGIQRLYQGLPFALVQGPMTRFGDTAANVGILALLESFETTASLPLPLRTACGSIAAGLWRIFLMPVDTSKTAMQVEGSDGLQRLWGKVAKEGPSPLYQGSIASAAATAAGHFPWFLTYNFLNENLPVIEASDDLLLSLARSALLGLCASCVSDICSNSLRVLKTTKQTASLGDATSSDGEPKEISYKQAMSEIIEKDGLQGLFGRGLQTRLLTNAIQGAAFSVLWKYFQQV